MVKAEQDKISTIVRRVLETKTYTRSSNDQLYVEVLKDMATTKGVNLADHSVVTLLSSRKAFGFPSYESVTRARRKLQEQDSSLRADADVEAMRELRAGEYSEWAIQTKMN